MIKNLMLLCLFAGIFQVSFGQIVLVVDRENGEPLELVTLASENPRVFVTTNARGQADISELKGAAEIVIRSLGFNTKTLSYAEIEQNEFRVVLEAADISLDGVVVSAARRTETKREITSRVTSITPSEIALQNPQTAADMLGSSGEVFIQKSQMGGGSPMIRGFATNRLLITVDGVRMNTAIFRSGNLQNVISLDPFATESAEVLFGPGSVIYGSDAIGGVMSFQTLTPQFTYTASPLVSGKAVTRYSSASNERTNHFDVNLGFRKWSLLTSITHSDFDDLRMGRHGPSEYLRPFYVQRQDSMDVVVANEDPLVQRPTAYSQTNLMQKIRWKPNTKWDFNYGFHYSTTTDYARYDRHIRLRNGLPRSGEWYYGPQEWAMNSLRVSRLAQTAAFDQVDLTLAHQFFQESRIDRDFNGDTRYRRVEEVNAYSANLDFTKVISGKNKLYYGLEGILNDVSSAGTDENILTGITFEGASRYPQATWSSYAAYLTYQHRLSEKFSLQGGVRYNQFAIDADFDTTFYPFPYTKAEINNSAVTGSLGVIFSPTEKFTARINASTGFRSPNVDDMGKVFDSEPGTVIVPNPGLNAEYAYNLEAGIAKVFGDVLEIEVSGYYTLLEDAMVRRDFQLNGRDFIVYEDSLSRVQAIQNAARATVYGVNLDLEVNLSAGFGFSTNFNYQKGEEELDDGTTSPLRHAAPWFGASHLTYNANKLVLDFYAVYSGELSYKNLAEEERGKDYLYAIDENGNPYSPSWYTLNFKAKHQLSEHLTVSGGIENLTDQRYRPYSSGITAAGRNFILSLKASF